MISWEPDQEEFEQLVGHIANEESFPINKQDLDILFVRQNNSGSVIL